MRIHDYLDYWAMRQGGETYADDGERSVTWKEMQEWSRRVGAWFGDRFDPGDRVAVLSKNSLDFAAIYYGAFRAGVVLVPLNFRLAPSEWRYIIQDAGAVTVLVEAELADGFESVRAELGVPSAVIGGERDGWIAFDAEVAVAPIAEPKAQVGADDAAYQMYTSGTTGHPKGAVLSHRSVTENVAQFVVAAGLHRKRAMVVMPMFHAGAAVAVFAYTASGMSMSIVRDFDPAVIAQRLRAEHVSTTTLVPAMIQALISMPDIEGDGWPDLEMMGYGASPISTDVLTKAMAIFGCEFFQVFGMTETSAMATFLAPEDHRRAVTERPELLLSAGRPALGTQLRIIDADGTDLPVGEIGEILVRGPQVMDGYWNLPDATKAALQDGWLHTGDAGRVDEDGYLFISDRIKDMVVTGGENVYPREVEEVLFSMKGIADATVIGVPDERWGEAVKAVVVLANDVTVDAEAVINHCRESLAAYKCPRSVDFVTELPRNATGKVLKRELRAGYWEGHSRGVN